MRLTPGTRVGPYEVVALLGAGGMAEVYRARDTRLGRDVAVKVVSDALGRDGAFLERFDREAKLAASLTHPNIVALHDVGLHEGQPYFVTELLQGESLRERLAKGPIPLGTALDWAAQMAQGLAAAHERGIVHRDLKPENVFLTRDGHVKLLDFGIAKLIETAQATTPHGLLDDTVTPSGSSTGTGMVLGTPGYMSPEQVRGDPVDARTDFFSLGAVLYEMLCGRKAFATGPVSERSYAILHGEPEPLPAAVPPQVAQVVHRCLEKDPARRFQSARDLAFNLELVRAPTGSTTGPATLAAPARTSAWRRWAWSAAAALLAGLATAPAMYAVGRDTRPPPPSVQSLLPRLGRVSAGRFNPDGRVIFSAAWDGEPVEVFAQTPGTPEAQPLGLRSTALLAVSRTGELAVLVKPRWDPAGGGLIGTLALVPGAGGTPREVAENVISADWSPTGELAVRREVEGGGGLESLEYPLGKVIFEPRWSAVAPRVSPSGDSVAFFDVAAKELKLVDRKGQARTLASVPTGGLMSLAWAPNGEEVWLTNGDGTAIWATSTRTGRTRLVYQGVFPMDLEDISKDGRVLVHAMDIRYEVLVAPPGKQPQRRLSIDDAQVRGLSGDGRQVLLEAESGTYLRPTNGGAPLKLGSFMGSRALSPDAKWVLVREKSKSALELLPVGPGPSRTVSGAGLEIYSAEFFHDGNRIVFVGRHPEARDGHLYVSPLDGGNPVAMSDAGVSPGSEVSVSRDDRFVSGSNLDLFLTLYPTDGGSPVPLTELGKFAQAIAWTPEGHLWVRPDVLELPTRILLYDVAHRRVLKERPFSLNDATGIGAVLHAYGTPDATTIAFDYERVIGHLYLLDGLDPPRR